MKNIFTILFVVLSLQSFGQDSALPVKHDTGRQLVPLTKPGTSQLVKKTLVTDTGRQAAVSGIQANDTTQAKNNAKDSLQIDSLKNAPVTPKAIVPQKPVGFSGEVRTSAGKEELFYIIAGLLLFLGLIKAGYPKYFQNIFRQFFQASLRQKQTPEQIVQGYVPGFLLNLLFFMAGGMCIALYGVQNNFLKGPLWLLIVYCTSVLACIYLLKYLVILFAGWVFNEKQAAGTYSFIVFLVNRIIGLVLLPLLILLAFYGGGATTIMFTVAGSIVVILLIYRYAVSLTIIGKNLKVSALHFFIYLCAVELMPLLVIYKVLFSEIAGNK